MGVIGYVLVVLLSGLVIGGLGRLAVPGPNPMSLWRTIAIGLAGSFIGGLLAALVGGGLLVALFAEVAVAAALVVLAGRRDRRRMVR